VLGEDEKAENRRRLFGDVTSGDIAEPETTVEEEKKPAAKQAKAVAAAVAEKVNQESM
jgi:putative ABC transport system ATP-binding protein